MVVSFIRLWYDAILGLTEPALHSRGFRPGTGVLDTVQ
jgi:hypothetical protein